MSIPAQPNHLRVLASFIFGSRWLQVPLYVGLIIAQCVYVVLFLKELWHLLSHATTFSEQQIMLIVLALIDVVMISNLLVMVIVGGYETFVSRLQLEGHPDQPEWLDHVNASGGQTLHDLKRGRLIGVAAHDIGDKGLFPLRPQPCESVIDPCHEAPPAVQGPSAMAGQGKSMGRNRGMGPLRLDLRLVRLCPPATTRHS